MPRHALKHRPRDEEFDLDDALDGSFPASDPVSIINPSIGVKADAARPKDRYRAILEEVRELLDLDYHGDQH
jgi:hypothetical protein